jgi:NADPH:quinone reductase-like Zn-dependent oxidoreductase
VDEKSLGLGAVTRYAIATSDRETSVYARWMHKLIGIALFLNAAVLSADHATMRAVSIAKFGGPEVLRVESVARPVASPGELLVRVHAASVNPVDALARAGEAEGITGAAVPYVPGFDISGVVVAIGPGVKSFRRGDAVFAMLDLRRGGGYAEYAVVKESEAARKPRRLSHIQAAAVPLTALTAWQALFDTADLKRGQTVLIHGGAGGVGSMAIQLAKWKGAHVIATASASNHDYLRTLGADVVIDYRAQKFDEVASDIDVVLDPIGGDTQKRSLAILRPGGILVSLVGLGPSARSATNLRAESILVKASGKQLAQIAEVINAGRLTPTVSHTFALDRASDAHIQSETGHTRGKIVLKIAT